MGTCFSNDTVKPISLEKIKPVKFLELVEIVQVAEVTEVIVPAESNSQEQYKDQDPDKISDLRIKIPTN